MLGVGARVYGVVWCRQSLWCWSHGPGVMGWSQSLGVMGWSQSLWCRSQSLWCRSQSLWYSCDFSVSPSPFSLDFGTLDFGLGLDKNWLLSLRLAACTETFINPKMKLIVSMGTAGHNIDWGHEYSIS